MKERKKIKYVEKQPPDSTLKNEESKKKYESQTGQSQIEREYKRQPKVEDSQNPPNTYLISHQEVQNQQPLKQYQNSKREEPRTKYAPKDTSTQNYEPKRQDEKYTEKSSYQSNSRKGNDLKAPRFVERSSSHPQQHCIICSQDIRRRDWIWTCNCCSISMHLRCIKQWIENINEQQQRKATYIFNWKCPQCNFEYNEPMPRYYCYCGKHLNPEEDRDLPPHSCGAICNKKRGANCPHTCPERCHKGKCKPCDFEGTVITCQCGKSQRTVKCSEERLAFQCGKKCQKILNCHRHKCERNCHPGSCLPCKKKHMAPCYCGKNEDIIDCSAPSYSCDQICNKLLDCKFHTCEQKCHIGDCNSCRKTPALQKTCPCGKYEIEMLTGDPDYRKSCSEVIPVCGMPCSKKHECGHGCPRSCHEGRCPQCKVMVEQSCNCGLQTRKIQCWKKQKEPFKCEAVCKKKRSCGQHLCNQICCKFRNSPIIDNHPCDLNCTKMLNCQKHQCGEPCHIGLCKKCPVIYSQPQACPCGKTFLKPPIICGTLTPECNNVCEKDMPCGHKCKNACHYGPCRCFQAVVIPCRCEKQQIPTTCGRQALCLVKCQNQLACGHKCDLQCHKGTCEQAHKSAPCRKTCNKQRSDCRHFCPQLCHPGQLCEQFSCEAQIMVKCQCGHRQTMTLCGAKDNHKTRKAIVCNKRCQNLRRFDIFYKDKQIYYPGNMVQFAFKNYPYLQNLQSRLQKFILHSEQNFIQIQYKFPDNGTKLLLTNLFQNHYHLNTHFYKYRKYAAFTLMQSQHTMIPKPVLTEYIKLISKGTIKQANLPFEFTISFDCQVKQKWDLILKGLKNYLHKYYSERNNRVVSLHFWNKDEGEDALKYLQNQYQTIQFKCSFNVTKPEEQITQKDIIQEEVTEEEKKQEQNQTKHEPLHKDDVSPQKISQSPEPINNEQKEKGKELLVPKRIPSKEQVQGNPKLIVRRGVPAFKKNAYPDAKQHVQDIYLLDEDQLYGQTMNWPQYIQKICLMNMGPQATQWRIRSVLMLSSVVEVKQNLYHDLFTKLIQFYNKDKQSAMRILQIQRIDSKSVKKQMQQNGIYLSDHQPEMLSYLLLFNYMAEEKIVLQLPTIVQKTPEVTKTHQILQAVQNKNPQIFYQMFTNADYLFACALIPIIHYFRQIIIEQIAKGGRIPSQNLAKYLLFESDEAFTNFCQANGIVIASRISKTTKAEVYYLKQGQLKTEHVKDENFIKQQVFVKRDKKYFLVEPTQLLDDRYMTRSFFAFGDFKESVNPMYMTALVKLLKSKE